MYGVPVRRCTPQMIFASGGVCHGGPLNPEVTADGLAVDRAALGDPESGMDRRLTYWAAAWMPSRTPYCWLGDRER